MGVDECPRRWLWRCFLLFVGITTVSTTVTASDSLKNRENLVSRIAFGSCSNQSAPQPIWDAVADFNPQIFILMGDNIYGDIKRPFKIFGRERTIGPWKNVPRFLPASEQEMEAKYQKAKSNPGYARVKERAEVIGTWDDHDYGLNDAGKEFHKKKTNQKLFLDFFDEPQDSPRRKQAGVYASYTYGPMGKDVKVVLLDTRYHRDPVGSDGTILGDSQWSWLERELKGPPTAITIIGSSIQVISNLSATLQPLVAMESWGRFPKERDRLFKLIADSKRGGVLFISGDVHFGEITRYDCASDYPLFDLTSSGLTQSVEEVVPRFLRPVVRFFAWLTPSTMRVKGPNCKYKSCVYGQPNFGTIEINWDSHPVNVKFEIRDKNGIAVTGVNVSLSELHPSKSETLDKVKTGDNQRHCTLEASLPWIKRYRIAILFYFTIAVLLLAIFLCLSCACVSIFRLGGCKRKHE
ncbi:uncharacterized protein LOC131616014 isoform X2 [Vicia villosa]|uniref:uncharacterized protein LOC131616014 isoform X2 n=1 Tax=Vicia villosa TaxID=3911 RepID=UPI00273BC2EC|nr:uncharacterized protein LOC131616014 isoform X2 [Vicia villosa]